jgi:hypothetical protein
MSVRSGSPTPSALSDQSLGVKSALKPTPQQDEVIFKLVFAGPHNSGKTAFVRQLQLAKNLMPAAAAAAIDSDQASTTGDGPTIGVDFSSVVYIVKKPQEVNIRLQLWDTAGKGGYTLTDDESTAVYQNVNAISVFFDCRSYASFRRAQDKWLPYALKQVEGKPLVGPECIFLVGTRSKEWNPTSKDSAGDPQSLDLDMISIEEEDDEDDIGTSTNAIPRREVCQDDIDTLLQTFPSIPKANVFCVDCSDGKSIQPWIAKTCQVLLVRFANEVKKVPSKSQEEKEAEPPTKAADANRMPTAEAAAGATLVAAPPEISEPPKAVKPPPAAVATPTPAPKETRAKPADVYSPREEEPENSEPKQSDDDHSDKEVPSEPESPHVEETERPRPPKPDTPTESEKDSDDSDDSDSSDGEGGKKKKKKKPKPKPKPKKRVRSRYSDTEDEDEEEEEPTPVRREPVDAKSGCCSGGGCTCS